MASSSKTLAFLAVLLQLLAAGNAKLSPDCATLLLLKSSISRDPAGTLRSWNSSINPDCCHGWTGVKCRRNTSRVIHLLLSNGDLSGTLHPGLGSLSSLEKLDLSNNHLSGPIPSSVTKLSKLTLLDLAYNFGLNGPIPSSIGDMSSLVRIRLQSNKLSGSIPASFGSLSNLVYLELDDNLLTGRVPDGFTSKTRNLAFLVFEKNKLTGLPANLSGLARLGILYLSSNPVTFNSIRGILTLPFLGELHLDNCGFGGRIPLWLTSLKLRQSDDFLTSMLSLSRNSLSGEIPQQIARLDNVELLRLSENMLSGRIPSSLGSMGSLQQVWLEKNRLSGAIPQTLIKLDALRFLNVSYNRLSGEIPQRGGRLSTLEASSFAGNPGLCGKPLPAFKHNTTSFIKFSEYAK